jgi:formate hydrogenlyase transcriptional activator
MLQQTQSHQDDLRTSNAGEVLPGQDRYHALLKVSGLLAASESDIQTALHSVSALLSRIIGFDRIALLLASDDGKTARVYALESDENDKDELMGREFPLHDTSLETVLVTQQPRYVPCLAHELEQVPGLLEATQLSRVSSAYMFPVSSARRRLGILIIVNNSGNDCSSQDVELMTSVAMHFANVLETALAVETSESLKRSLARERDRLRLILEVNNHTIAHLDVGDLFRAASKSLRSYFDNEFTSFWVYDERTEQLELSTLDFGTGRGLHEKVTTSTLTREALTDMRARVAAIFGPDEIAEFPQPIAKSLRESSIVSVVCVPLVGNKGPLGIISLGSREPDSFDQNDLELLSQIANQISLAIENALAYRKVTFSCRRLEHEREYLESELQTEYNFEDIVGKSTAIKSVLEQVAIVAPTDSSVLLIGESGTGKELIARAIHNLSSRRDCTFVRLNCAAVPSGLLESELFGHEKGAFTGALAQKRGRIELAHDGSLFLDEIGDIGLDLQPKLLRVLQEREFERLGSNKTIKVDTRLVAATHRDLPGMVRKGEFREDLFYRLNVFPIHMPPLRERKGDIPLLVHYFVATLSRKMKKSIRVIPDEVMSAINSFPWPGNVRELQNFIERSVILSRDETLAAPISELRQSAPVKDLQSGTSFHAMEREVILKVLREAGGKLSGAGGAAERLGLKRTTLQRKMQRLSIFKADYV